MYINNNNQIHINNDNQIYINNDNQIHVNMSKYFKIIKYILILFENNLKTLYH